MKNIFLTSLTVQEIRQLFQEELEKFFDAHSIEKSNVTREPANRRSAAKFLGVSLPTLDILLKTNQIKSFKIGRQVRIDWNALEDYVKKSKVL